ncbi:MAG: GHKL domain-containing protein [Pedobacter sp.]|nr:MAG: GHKL domain-containing protein [Pedobacter sp.]
MINVKKWALLVLLYIGYISTAQSDEIIVKQNNQRQSIGEDLYYFIDESKDLGIKEIEKETNFLKSNTAVPNFGVVNDAVWLRFTVVNNTNENHLNLQIDQPVLDDIELYTKQANGKYSVKRLGEAHPFDERLYDKDASFIFRLDIPIGEKATYFVRVQSTDNIQLPIYVGSEKVILEASHSKFLISGLYIGIMLSMLLYNIFIYFTVRDKSYLYYVCYIVFVILTQASIQGFTFQFLYPNNTTLALYSSFIFTPLVGITGLQFERHFLRTKEWLPKTDKFSVIFIVLYIVAMLLAIFGQFALSFRLIEVVAATMSMFMFYMAVVISKRGYRPATFFLVAWSVFLVGIIIYTMKDFGILPYNDFTYYTMPFGSALEVTLLSFALADKINIFKKEKEQSQAEALKAITENEKLVREQNVILEIKVKERTEELELANDTLNTTLKDLKEAQSQLVDSEKMAGLGQLTAGIAHEINNPINFVTSNIKPLELDINDLDEVIGMYEKLDLNEDLVPQISKIESFKKQIDIVFVREEIKSLLSGIGEGARRTAEIIRSLKNFSRLDENDTKPVDLNEGLNSTLVLVKNTFPDHLKVIKELGNLPKVECLPGKINQVFMNLITNAVHAIKTKQPKDQEGVLSIKTWQEGDSVKISIKDSGTGMPEEVKQKIFEPFFTTKDVGEGTGLGLSIVFRIIENHHGNIDVRTKINQGTEFIITLPVNTK